MRIKNLLLVEDCPEQLKTYAEYVQQLGFSVLKADNEKNAIEILSTKTVDVLLCDVHLSSSLTIDSFEGMRVIEYAAINHPEIVIIAMSNDPKATTYYRTFETGAMAYIKKPILRKDEILIGLNQAAEKEAAKRLKDKYQEVSTFARLSENFEDGIVLDATKRKLAAKLAAVKNIPIIISGETGTGKEEYVKLIQNRRQEAEKKELPLVAINCANIDSTLAISTLFGHVRGAFTGADKTTKGAIGEADGGVLFLDEIQNLSLDCQKRLLRVLNDGSYERLGDSRALKSDFQLVVATTKNLDDMVSDGKFLLDLRMRISGIDIVMDPLRMRKNDIPALVSLFLNRYEGKMDDAEFNELVERCKSLYWQGNIRQLGKAIQSLVTVSSLYDEPILAKNLPISPLMCDPKESPIDGVDMGLAGLAKTLLEPILGDSDFVESVERYEKLILANALKRHKTVKSVCDSLNIARSSLDSKRAKFKIEISNS